MTMPVRSCVGIGDFKDVSRQLIANPLTEIVAMGEGEKIDC